MYNSLIKKISNIQKTALMFKKKKTTLIRKIWRLVKLTGISKAETTDLKSKLRSLLKSLAEKDLETLLRSLQTRGGVETECIHVKTLELRHFTKYLHSDPKYILAQAFRYPQLTSDDYLRNLICCCESNLCSQECDGCINPFHSSLVVYTEFPLPPYSETPSTPSAVITTNDTICSTYSERTCSSLCSTVKPISLGTSLTMNLFPDDSCTWCRISYWEQKHRIGRMFDVSENCINVFENLPQGGGFCLGLLNRGNVEKSESCEKVRESIGHGFQLSKEPDGVWLYNRSNIVLFTSSPTIQTEGVDINYPVVKRLTPGSSVLVLDPNFLPDVNEKMKIIGQSLSFFKNETSKDSGSYVNDKLYSYCVRVSFGKGWGHNYTRMSITQCPCWVEIYLNVQVSK